MLRSALRRFTVLPAVAVSDPTPLLPRSGSVRLYHSLYFQSRWYNNGSNYRDQKFPNRVLEDGESLQSRSWSTYAIPAAVLLIAGTGLYIHHNDEKRAILKGSEQSVSYGRNNNNRPAIGGPFKLFDTENNTVTESTFRGNWVLMYFGYTSSPDAGPREVKKMADVMKILEFDPGIIGLTGPVSAVRQTAQEFRAYFKKVDEEGQDYLVESSNNMYLLDPNMEMVRFFGAEYDPQQLADAIIMEVNKGSR
ncbi:hypothetical protein ZIOFF_076098 [Zingiber officinale]|uniref:Uncharacterized protein n=1 Tax=Zingiber officinale TaxID=94328 RepID=A0A8J5CPJ8_ZINOF|nr:hypothetical protein ZIOFF_076098 [Zingiber officinale]